MNNRILNAVEIDVSAAVTQLGQQSGPRKVMCLQCLSSILARHFKLAYSRARCLWLSAQSLLVPTEGVNVY